MARRVGVGTIVRIPLHGRRIRGWVVAEDVTPPADRRLLPLAGVVGWGPSPELVALADWAAWRWAGRSSSFLRAASPAGVVRSVPERRPPTATGLTGPVDDSVVVLATDALSRLRSVVRLPPGAEAFRAAVVAARLGPALLVTGSVTGAARLEERLRADGVNVARVPEAWAVAAAGGCSVVGARAAAWAPVPELRSVVVFDAHDEALADQRAPTWNAWEVAAERARQAGVPCVVVSPCPTLEHLAWAPLLTMSRTDERRGWPPVHIVDRRHDDPRLGLYSSRLVELVRSGQRVACILNRKGRARLLACTACAELTRCEDCGGACELVQPESGRRLICARCRRDRPVLCQACGAVRLKVLRIGVTRAREELAALAGVLVGEVTGDSDTLPDHRVLVGTEALLHRLPPSWAGGAVAFLDFDQELLAPRYRAAEHALALLCRAAQVVGDRAQRGSVLVQTRLPRHEVLDAAVHADPGRLASSEGPRRERAWLPPTTALALISGDAAADFVAALGPPIEVLGPTEGRYLLRAGNHRILCDALAATTRPPGRLRVEVDPLRA